MVNYLNVMLGDPSHDVLFVGYQARGSPGYAIQKYVPQGGYVDLDGERYIIRAGVETIGGYSAHADHNDLVRFVGGIRRLPREVRLVHGDAEAKEALRGALVKRFSGIKVLIPN